MTTTSALTSSKNGGRKLPQPCTRNSWSQTLFATNWELAPAKDDFRSRQKTRPVKNVRRASTASPLFSLANLKRSLNFLLEVCVNQVLTRLKSANKTCRF